MGEIFRQRDRDDGAEEQGVGKRGSRGAIAVSPRSNLNVAALKTRLGSAILRKRGGARGRLKNTKLINSKEGRHGWRRKRLPSCAARS